MKDRAPNFADRLTTAAKAKQVLIDKARAKAAADATGATERQASRIAVVNAREARAGERKAQKQAEDARLAAEQKTEEAARPLRLKAEQERRDAELAANAATEAALQAEQKAMRDARYAARKARTK